MPQQHVSPGLIPRPKAFQPFQNVHIEPDRHRLLGRAVELADLGAAPVHYSRDVREVNVFVPFCRDRGDVSLLLFGELPHRISFRATPQPERR